MKTLGAVLSVLGVLTLPHGGIRYAEHEELIDAGPIHASVDEKRIPLPPVAGAAAVVIGLLLITRRSHMV